MTTYIKCLRADGTSPYQLHPWPLPTQGPDGQWIPGEWVAPKRHRKTLTPGDVDACVHGAVYGSTVAQLPLWVDATAYYLELDGAVEGADKTAGRRGRLLRPVEGWEEALRTWAYECADRAVRIHAVAALRSSGLTEQADTLAALPPIVDGDAAKSAAKSAARAAEAAEAAAEAAWDVARDVARAAESAAWDVAWAAWAAARDAWAAGDAARDAARAAELEWQGKRLAELAGLS